MTRIIQITDTHIVRPGTLAYGVVDTAAALQEAVATITRLLPMIGPIDAVIVSGDLTDFGDPEEYRRFRSIMSGLTLPLAVVPGNHDRREPLRSAFADLPTMPASGPVNWRLEFPDLRVIGLDTLVDGFPHGELAPETLVWLAETLAQAPDVPALVAMHHPPFPTGIVHMDRQNLRNGEALFAAISNHRAPLTLAFGHVHRTIMSSHRGTPMIIAPSPAHAVALDHRPDGPPDLMREPGGFLLHHTSGDGVRGEGIRGGIVSESVPVGRFPGPYPFFPES